MNRKIIGTLLGFVMGFLILHPLSMMFQGLIHPDVSIKLNKLVEAYNVHHLPMAFFFGILGALFGFMNIRYTLSLSTEKARVKMLEGLLPICAHCKKIRDDSCSEKGKGPWIKVDKYISSRTKTQFTHGMCPECYEVIMKELDDEDEAESADAQEYIGS